MNVPFVIEEFRKDDAVIPLKRMIARQLYWFQPIAVKRNSFIINDVPDGFCVSIDKDLLATMIHNLLDSVVRKASYSCIRVTVRRYSNTVLLRLTGGGSVRNQNCEINWQKIKPVAEKLGGCVITNDFSTKNLAVTFSFRCLGNAA